MSRLLILQLWLSLGQQLLYRCHELQRLLLASLSLLLQYLETPLEKSSAGRFPVHDVAQPQREQKIASQATNQSQHFRRPLCQAEPGMETTQPGQCKRFETPKTLAGRTPAKLQIALNLPPQLIRLRKGKTPAQEA